MSFSWRSSSAILSHVQRRVLELFPEPVEIYIISHTIRNLLRLSGVHNIGSQQVLHTRCDELTFVLEALVAVAVNQRSAALR